MTMWLHFNFSLCVSFCVLLRRFSLSRPFCLSFSSFLDYLSLSLCPSLLRVLFLCLCLSLCLRLPLFLFFWLSISFVSLSVDRVSTCSSVWLYLLIGCLLACVYIVSCICFSLSLSRFRLMSLCLCFRHCLHLIVYLLGSLYVSVLVSLFVLSCIPLYVCLPSVYLSLDLIVNLLMHLSVYSAWRPS